MIDSVNRVVLAVVGVLLVTAGAVGLLAAAGAIPWDPPSDLYASVASAFQARPWLWWVVAAVAALLVVLGLTFALRQLSRPAGPALDTIVVQRGGRGRTAVRAVAIADALEQDLQRLPAVTGSRVRVAPPSSRPTLRVSLDLGSDADLHAVRRSAEEPLRRAQHVLGAESLPAELRLRHTAAPPRRVR